MPPVVAPHSGWNPLRIPVISLCVAVLLAAGLAPGASAQGAESLDGPELIARALRLCRQVPDDDCRDLGPQMYDRPVRDEVRDRRLRAAAKVDLTLQLIRQQWLAGRHEEARAEAQRLISWGRAQKCPLDVIGERLRERLINVLHAAGTTDFCLEVVQTRAHENPVYSALGSGAEDTFIKLMACASIEEATAFLEPLSESARLRMISRSMYSLPNLAPLDSVVTLQHRLLSGSVDPAAYNNLALSAARAGRLDIASMAVDAIPDEFLGKADVLSFVAQELARAGRRSEATRLVTRAFDLDARRDPSARQVLDISGYEYAGGALVLMGASAELARRRPGIPDAAWRRILMIRASAAAADGHIEQAVADIKDAQALPGWLNFGANPIDDGVLEWIGAQADSGNDLAAVRALDRFHSKTLRGNAWSRIAQARARRGDVSGATAAADSITQSAYGLADAVPAIAVAQAAAGNLDQSLSFLEAASERLTAMCGRNDGPVDGCPHAPECPPMTMSFEMRGKTLRGIGKSIRTRAELNRLLVRREPVEQAAILLGAIESEWR